MSEALPSRPQHILDDAIAAAEAGASILHHHARDPVDGRPSPRIEHFLSYLPHLRRATDAVLNITASGALKMTVEERLAFVEGQWP